jgi:hypothetical protein
MRRCSISMGVADLESRCHYAAALRAQELRIYRFNALPCVQHTGAVCGYGLSLCCYVISTGAVGLTVVAVSCYPRGS